ncbi:MAG: hypothetical protein CVU18_03935 [Betaproteobacteria bacterium HGW-Betaproteobacteria-12]|nr:MAG: hypothetical protein CVU18_03935 [Betaproteobacteria bacterium HGW-Betaproteobacteria-12]
MQNQSDASQLPEWIPWGGKLVYETIQGNGGFSQPRMSDVMDKLFFSPQLKSIWQSLSELSMPEQGWSYLIGSLVYAIECAPERGKRATKETGSEKRKILDRQQAADKLLRRIESISRELAATLAELENNGGQLPSEAYSGLALIRSSIETSGASKACCEKQFRTFERSLSSYERSHFPSPESLILGLAEAAKEHPACAELYADDPWLSSGQSSWKDYVRVLMAEFEECKRMYGTAPKFTDAQWTLLLQVFIDKSISRQTVSKGLIEL